MQKLIATIEVEYELSDDAGDDEIDNALSEICDAIDTVDGVTSSDIDDWEIKPGDEPVNA